MKVVIVNKSDSTGGAAVVSRRLMEALRAEGVDARMLVVEKLTDSPFVELAAPKWRSMIPFLAERLRIFTGNGFSRRTLFRIDTGSDGLPLWEHPLVREADAILLNWVNQGMLSLDGVERLLRMGKPVIWTMHDMWCMTGICHHAGSCTRYWEKCRECPLLGKRAGRRDLSSRVFRDKSVLYSLDRRITFVAVSRWLMDRARRSYLLGSQRVEVIPNAFNIPDDCGAARGGADGRIRILFGAARLDDPVKGLPSLKEMTRILASEWPGLSERLELVTFGGVKDPSALDGMGIAHRHLGVVRGEKALREVYLGGDILVSASSYETLPGTLVEAQAYGCVPVSFDRGGQGDIVEHLQTGYLASYSENAEKRARALVEGVVWAARLVDDAPSAALMRRRMRDSVEKRFGSRTVARAYIRLIEGMK